MAVLEGTFLWHHETDEVARVVQYRAKAEICNACSLKSVCTDASDGRTLMRPLDGWPHSEMARFQRALSLSLMILAAMLCAVELARQETCGSGRVWVRDDPLDIPCPSQWRRQAVRTALFGS
jgi:hypothetical protein